MPRQSTKKAQTAVAETQVAVQAATQAVSQAVPQVVPPPVEKKTRGRKPAQPVQPAPALVQPVVQPPPVVVPVEKKTRGRKPAQPAQPVQSQESSDQTAVSQESSEPRKRTVPTADTVKQEFDELSALIESEISAIKESAASSLAASKSSAASSTTPKPKAPSTKTLGVKFLRTVNKRLKILAAHTARLTKRRKPENPRNNVNSGFRKPVQISDELARFTGWDPSQKYSRVDVTKYMCNYIKEKGLQKPEDKREIEVHKDAALQQLLKYDNTSEPLRYYSLQTCLAPHFQPSSTA